MNRYQLDPAVRVGFVAVKTADLAAMTAWYRDLLGLEVLYNGTSRVLLGVQVNRRVLLILEAGGTPRPVNAGGIVNFSIDVPDIRILHQLAARLAKTETPPHDWFENGFAEGFHVTDPEGNDLVLDFDRGARAEPPRGYNFGDGLPRPIDAPRLPGIAKKPFVLPAGVNIGGLTVRTSDLPRTLSYLSRVLGFTIRHRDETSAYLTVGDTKHHAGILVQKQSRAQAADGTALGPRYMNLVLPTVTDFDLLNTNVGIEKWQNVNYDPDRNYLMVTGPNKFMLWFSVA